MLSNLNKFDIVLGSNSPRRRQLLTAMNVNFRVEAIKDVDESYDPSMDKMDVAPYTRPPKSACAQPQSMTSCSSLPTPSLCAK